jgi:prepilin-type N-terminal cleavage/methylation domain-containing protein
VNKGFTLIEVILALMIASLASIYVIKSISKNDFNKELLVFQDNLQSLIEDGLISPTGYMIGDEDSSSTAPCADGNDFLGLDSKKLVDCLKIGDNWNDITAFGSGISSYIISNNFMRNYGGCKVSTAIDPLDTTNRSFFVYVDCSSVDYDDNVRTLAKIESAIDFLFVRKLEYMFDSVQRDSNAIDSSSGGDANDGKIRAKFIL